MAVQLVVLFLVRDHDSLEISRHLYNHLLVNAIIEVFDQGHAPLEVDILVQLVYHYIFGAFLVARYIASVVQFFERHKLDVDDALKSFFIDNSAENV